MKHRDPKKVGRKGFIWLTLAHGGPSLEEVRTGIQAESRNWRQGLIQRPWRTAVYWLARPAFYGT